MAAWARLPGRDLRHSSGTGVSRGHKSLLAVSRASAAIMAIAYSAAAHTVADLDRRLGQIDTAIEEAAKRGRTNTALSAMEAQRRARVSLVGERNEAAGTLSL